MLTKFNVKDDKRPAVKNWKTYNGPVSTPMYGVVIPDGVYVIDLDLYKGVTTGDVDKALGCSLDWGAAELQETKNGGIHYAFQCSDDLKQGSDLLGVKGFDTRASGKGYIATGKGYTDISLFGFDSALIDYDLLPTLPGDAVDKLANRVVAVVDNDLSDLEQAIEERPSEFSNDDIAAYLEALGDEYAEGDQWLKVGMAVYHETKGSEDGYMLFDAFSRRCPDSYDSDMNRRRWESFGGGTTGNRITFASVIHWAGGPSVLDQVKYEDLTAKLEACGSIGDIDKAIKAISAEPLSKINIDMLAKVAQDKYKQVTGTKPSLGIIKSSFKAPAAKREVVSGDSDFVGEYVFITSTDKYFHKETKAQMSQKAFDTKHNRMTPQDEENRITASRYAERAIHCVESDMYAPAFGELFTHENLEYINSYRKSLLVATPIGETDIVDRVMGHVAHLLVSKEQQEILINYLAHCVQYPGRKIHWGIVLQGVQGDGKSFFAEMMQHVMGKNNVRTLDVQVLNSEFTGWSVGQCITFIEELKLDNYKKYEVLNNLKPFIANETITVHAKGKDPKVAPNTTNYFALTNYKDALPIDDNDRRYCILYSQWQSGVKLRAFISKHKNYYKDLYDDMRANAGELLTWLSDWKISDAFMEYKRAPETDARSEMVKANTSDAYLCVQDAIEEFSCPEIGDELLNITMLSKMVSLEGCQNDYANYPKNRGLKHVLNDMGYHYIDVIKNKDRKNQRYYSKNEALKKENIKDILKNNEPYMPF